MVSKVNADVIYYGEGVSCSSEGFGGGCGDGGCDGGGGGGCQ